MEVTPTHMHILEGGKGDPTRGRKVSSCDLDIVITLMLNM